jgi:hypothetical protein
VPEPSTKSVPEVATELWALTKGYAKQETIDPLKGVGRYLGFGFAGAFLGAFGVMMLLLALLRALQTQVDAFEEGGSLTWVPYFIVLIVGCVLIGLAISRIKKKKL